MRAGKTFLALAAMALTAGAVQASSLQNILRISITVIDRCDIRTGQGTPSVDCSTGVPWMLAPASAAITPSLVTGDDSRPSSIPAPRDSPIEGAQVTTIVF